MPAKRKFLKLPQPLARWIGHDKVRRSAWSILFFMFALAILSLHFLPERVNLEVGQVSPIDIKSNRFLTFQDEAATERKRQEAALGVQDVYELNRDILRDNLQEISGHYKKVMGVIINPALTEEEKVTALNSLQWNISEESWNKIIQIEPVRIEAIETQTKLIVESIFAKGVNIDSLDFATEKVFAEVELLNLDPTYRQLIKGVLSSVEFKPNLLYNPMATEERRKEARDTVEPITVVIQKDEKIVSAGEVLTKRHIDILTWLGYKKDGSPVIVMLGLGVFVALIMFLVGIFLRHYRKELYRNENYLVLLMLLVLITLGLSKLIFSINLSSSLERAEQVGHMIPIAAGSMLIAILLDVKLAVFITGIFAVFTGLITGQIPFVLTALTGGLIGVFGVSRLSQRSDLAMTGIYIALANMVSVVAMGLLYNYEWSVLLMGVAFGILNGILSSVLTIGLLPYLESVFGITTSVRLLELSNPNHPLLKKLLLEAPGTYHHSILVGNLGEAAADSIGADSLLVRVGAYYHDVGKIKRPYFFVENQVLGDNPHEKISPPLSTLIITSHVKDGVELAKEHGVPQIIVDLIAQHHGKSLVKYFYHKALETEKEDTIKEEDFRYETPKPQSKEAAVILLADNVEAAVRSLKQPTPGRIEGMVRNIIKDRLNDGQLDECDLTFKDLDKIANAFVRVLNGIFHSRIEYPESVLKAMEKKKKGEKNVSNTDQPAASGPNTPSVGN